MGGKIVLFQFLLWPTLIIDYGRHAVRDSIEYQHFLGLSDTWRASWGAEYRRDSVQAPQLFNTITVQRANSLRAYTNLEWRPLTDWTFNLGGLLERDYACPELNLRRGWWLTGSLRRIRLLN
jgi:hypothetical protein